MSFSENTKIKGSIQLTFTLIGVRYHFTATVHMQLSSSVSILLQSMIDADLLIPDPLLHLTQIQFKTYQVLVHVYMGQQYLSDSSYGLGMAATHMWCSASL